MSRFDIQNIQSRAEGMEKKRMSKVQDTKVSLFTAADFDRIGTSFKRDPQLAADIANKKLSEAGVRVYGYRIDSGEWCFHEFKPSEYTHEGTVFNIHEVKKEPVVFETTVFGAQSHIESEVLYRFRGKKVKVTVEEVP